MNSFTDIIYKNINYIESCLIIFTILMYVAYSAYRIYNNNVKATQEFIRNEQPKTKRSIRKSRKNKPTTIKDSDTSDEFKNNEQLNTSENISKYSKEEKISLCRDYKNAFDVIPPIDEIYKGFKIGKFIRRIVEDNKYPECSDIIYDIFEL